MCDTLPEGKVSLATITERWRSSAKRQPGRRLGSRSSGEGHQRRFDRTDPFHRIDLVGQQILIAKLSSEEHTSELQSLMRIPYAVFCLKKKRTYERSPLTHRKQITHHTYKIYTHQL